MSKPHNLDRIAQVMVLRAKGLSCKQVGAALKPPISRQRVSYILTHLPLTKAAKGRKKETPRR